jgi:hypothetical protein
VALTTAAAVAVMVGSETCCLRTAVGTKTVVVVGMLAAGFERIAPLVVTVLEIGGRSSVVAALTQTVGMGCSLIVAVV